MLNYMSQCSSAVEHESHKLDAVGSTPTTGMDISPYYSLHYKNLFKYCFQNKKIREFKYEWKKTKLRGGKNGTGFINRLYKRFFL